MAFSIDEAKAHGMTDEQIKWLMETSAAQQPAVQVQSVPQLLPSMQASVTPQPSGEVTLAEFNQMKATITSLQSKVESETRARKNAEAQAKAFEFRSVVDDKLHKMGFIDPVVARNQMDQSKVAIDPNGNITGLVEEAERIAGQYPYLLRPEVQQARQQAAVQAAQEGQMIPQQKQPAQQPQQAPAGVFSQNLLGGGVPSVQPAVVPQQVPRQFVPTTPAAPAPQVPQVPQTPTSAPFYGQYQALPNVIYPQVRVFDGLTPAPSAAAPAQQKQGFANLAEAVANMPGNQPMYRII